MRRLIPASLLLCLVSCLAFAAAGLAGSYAGSWTGASGDGDFKIALAPASAPGQWTADVSFTFSGQEVTCKTAYVNINGAKLEIAYDFNLGGLNARSTITGQIHGNTLSGDYTTKGEDGSKVDSGTWKASLVK